MNISCKADILKEIDRRRISAIIRTNDQQLAADAMSAAVAGGFRIVEFTLTTPGALELIAEFARGPEELLVGAGTVMTPQQADSAVQAGARFLVSPVCDPEIIACAQRLDVVSIPGTFTATELVTAHRAGADLLKLFPAPADVAQYVKSILGPLPYLKIFPTAGVDIENMREVLDAGAAGIGFVRSLFAPADVDTRNFDAIQQRASAITARMQSPRE